MGPPVVGANWIMCFRERVKLSVQCFNMLHTCSWRMCVPSFITYKATDLHKYQVSVAQKDDVWSLQQSFLTDYRCTACCTPQHVGCCFSECFFWCQAEVFMDDSNLSRLAQIALDIAGSFVAPFLKAMWRQYWQKWKDFSCLRLPISIQYHSFFFLCKVHQKVERLSKKPCKSYKL